jgi:hypothetical protein
MVLPPPGSGDNSRGHPRASVTAVTDMEQKEGFKWHSSREKRTRETLHRAKKPAQERPNLLRGVAVGKAH